MRWPSEPGSSLAKARIRAHQLLDAYHTFGDVTRSESYAMLAAAMGVPVSECHFGAFSLSRCRKAIAILEAGLPAAMQAGHEERRKAILELADAMEVGA